MDTFKSVESHIEFDWESDVDVDMDVSSVRSRRTAFTRSLAIRDHDSRRFCANQQEPIPLILPCVLSLSKCYYHFLVFFLVVGGGVLRILLLMHADSM